MLATLLASSKHLLLALLVQPLTDTLPVEPVRILILNDAKKQLPLLVWPRGMGYTRGTERQVAELAGRTVPVGNECGDAVPVRCPQILTIHSMHQAVACHHEEEVVGLVYFPVLASWESLVLFDESEQRLAGLNWRKDFDFLLESRGGEDGR